MKWKEFLKPTKWKIIVFAILFVIAATVVLSLNIYTLSILIVRGLLAAVVWYLVACLIVFDYKKFKKKK